MALEQSETLSISATEPPAPESPGGKRPVARTARRRSTKPRVKSTKTAAKALTGPATTMPDAESVAVIAPVRERTEEPELPWGAAGDAPAAKEPVLEVKRPARPRRPRRTTRAAKADAVTEAVSEAPSTPADEAHRDSAPVAEVLPIELPLPLPPATEARPPGQEPPPGQRRGRRRRRGGRGRRDRAQADGAPRAEQPIVSPAVQPPVQPTGPAVTPATSGWPASPPSEAPARSSRAERNRRRRGRRRAAAQAGKGGEPARAAVTVGPTPSAEAPMQVVPGFEDDDEEMPSSSGPSHREMIINVTAGDECRIAIIHEGRLEELHIERQSAESHVGNIYKGRVTNVEPSIQAAFVDFGLAKNGFLHISDVQPRYFPDRHGELEDVGKKVPRRDRPPIQKCLRRGQEVIVQITKEGVGTKGPTLTTYLSIPGRYLVMMPGMNRLGVSRKIEDEDARRLMRGVLSELSLPSGIGFILRTAGMDRNKRELQRDLNYLQRLWKVVEEKIRETRAPAELYQESDLVTRTIRDLYTPDFDRIVIDHAETAQKAREFMQIAMPRSKNVIELHTARVPIFHKYGIEQEIEKINTRHVPLPSGGSIVIDSTEAMVAIDVNSGKFRALDDAEETAYRINIEAAEEIARQLRLRDLGGLIVCDFIDMRMEKHKRAVERALREALKKHKERARLLRMSAFGLIEMTRQRQRPSIKRSIYSDCPHCKGSGLVKTLETMVLEVMRVLQLATHHAEVARISLTVCSEVATAVLNVRRGAVHQLEQETGKTINVKSNPAFGMDQMAMEFEDPRGRMLTLKL